MIRPAMKNWHQVSETLLELTRQTDEARREETIVNIDKCLDIRDQLQSQITSPFTVEEEALGKELLAMEESIQKKLTMFTSEIKKNIFDAKSKKSNMKNYVNPYSNITKDGTFYDTKN
ncbi:hypothetical protein MKY09_14305 [Psychrobacillus sp. FSL K6-4046]|uniref:hypothetical protein n=1 Tax=Psychrobacillus sp. FSL K6-4046 TaxID=2921550 RepID=UPI003159F0F3